MRGLVRVIIPMALWVGLGFIILYFGCVIIVRSDIIGVVGIVGWDVWDVWDKLGMDIYGFVMGYRCVMLIKK